MTKDYIDQIVKLFMTNDFPKEVEAYGGFRTTYMRRDYLAIHNNDCSSIELVNDNLSRFYLPVVDNRSERVYRCRFTLIVKDYDEDYLVFYLRTINDAYRRGLRVDSHDLVEQYYKIKLKAA